MFVEGRNDIKVPFYIHVDVATKMIIGYAMKNKTYGEVKKAIEFVDDQHKLMYRKLERLTFDRESAIVAMQDEIEARGIRLTLKAAGQKMGLAEVPIRLIIEKTRATKAGVRANYGYITANQFCYFSVLSVVKMCVQGVEHEYMFIRLLRYCTTAM